MQKALFGLKLNTLLLGLLLYLPCNYAGYVIWDTLFWTNPCLDTPTSIGNFAFMFISAALLVGFFIGFVAEENGARYGFAINLVPIVFLETAYLIIGHTKIPPITQRMIVWVTTLAVGACSGYLGGRLKARRSWAKQ